MNIARDDGHHDLDPTGSDVREDLERAQAAPDTRNVEPGLVPDGELRTLDPRFIPAESLSWWIMNAILGVGTLIGVVIVFVSTWPPGVIAWAVLAAALLLVGLLCWAAGRWPRIVYRHARWAASPIGLEIRRGVLWRQIVTVPQARVQHTDVTQGPIARRFGLATLTIHTAGTHNAVVSLDGLSYETALALRDFLITGGGNDAV